MALSLSKALGKLYAVATGEDFFAQVTRMLGDCLGAPLVTCAQVRVARRESRLLEVAANITGVDGEVAVAQAARWEALNPFIGHCCANAVGPVLAVADIMPEAQWRRSEYCERFLGELGLTDSTSLRFYAQSDCYCFCVHTHEPLEPSMRQLLELLAGHLHTAYQRYLAQSEALTIAPYRNLVVLDAQGGLVQADAATLQLLWDYFPQEAGRRERAVPDVVRDWAQAVTTKHLATEVFEVNALEQSRGNGAVCISALPSVGWRSVLLVEQTRSSPPAQKLLELGLSGREADVLGWVCEGKQNREIAIILGISVKTVSRHLGSIFEKLGCENRHAAMRIAWEAMGQSGGSSQ